MSDNQKPATEEIGAPSNEGVLSELPPTTGLKRIETDRASKLPKKTDSPRKCFAFTDEDMEKLFALSSKFPVGEYLDEKHPKMFRKEKPE